MAELAFLADDPAFLGTLASQVPTMLKGALPAVGKFLWSKLQSKIPFFKSFTSNTNNDVTLESTNSLATVTQPVYTQEKLTHSKVGSYSSVNTRYVAQVLCPGDYSTERVPGNYTDRTSLVVGQYLDAVTAATSDGDGIIRIFPFRLCSAEFLQYATTYDPVAGTATLVSRDGPQKVNLSNF